MKLVDIVFRCVCLPKHCFERHKSNLFTYLIILTMIVFFPSKFLCCCCCFMIKWRRKYQPSPVLRWRIPWTEEPGRLQSMGLQRVRYDCETNYFNFQVHWYFQSILFALFQILPIVLFLLSHQVANHVQERSQ